MQTPPVEQTTKPVTWWHNSVVYQIYPRSFCDSNGDGIGDIPGIISKLDYLEKLGVDVIWLSPVYKSPMDDNGYDISDYQDIAPEFGTLEDMLELLKLAKARGIRIIMDLVVNHSSDEHEWFKQARKSRDNPYRDYFIWRDGKGDGDLPDDQGSVFGGPAWEYDEQTQAYFYHQFSKRQPDLNWENPKVQDEVHKMMNWWLDKGIGGFRLDVIDLIGKDVDKGIRGNGPRLHPLLKEMNLATFGNRDVLTVGETWDATPETAKLYSNPERNELSMIFQFEHITLSWKGGDKWQPIELDLKAFKQVMTRWQTELSDQGWNSLFWNNHDLPRAVSKYGDDGEYRVKSAKMLATALHLLKGTPYIYQGEELGMTNVAFDSIDDYRDIETLNLYAERVAQGVDPKAMLAAIHENSRDNARTPMHWNNQIHAGFTTGQPWLALNPNYPQINAADALGDENSTFYHYQTLISLRKQFPIIVYGSFRAVEPDHEAVFAYLREFEGQQLLVVANFSAQKQQLLLPKELHGRSGECLIQNQPVESQLVDNLSLDAYESFALLLN
ncbi:alpha-glucosidase [Alginatibacterium sediminis]|uniref:Alpha-glucosidase n=1 Tax=Alginatibacterium sediminis TaxID=2164068 RepID=A0A420E671_9ALTE|nr:alpha-glucosidase [Alginatibacterium sediminis]RKF13216.1 alpha-glucosidase [Alginatibacterium sediminis]